MFWGLKIYSVFHKQTDGIGGLMVAMKTCKIGKRQFSGCLFVCLSMLGIILSSCISTPYHYANVTPLTSTSMVIYPSMTRNYRSGFRTLNILVQTTSARNKLTPESKPEEPELEYTLWLMIVGHPETYASFQAQSDQTITFEGFAIKILRIAKDDRGVYFIEIEVTEP
jgi:hypothetical protein